MPSFLSLRKTYSALSSSLPSSDDTYSGYPKGIIIQPSQSGPRTIPRYSFLIRFIIFVLLESGFIALVSATLHKPIFLHFSFGTSAVKGAATVIAIAWHALAVYVVKAILLNVFSAEWIEQSDSNGLQTLTLRELDVVSRLTTGFLEKAKHCASPRATPSFRLGFLSFFLLMLLNGIGPSAIGIDLASYDYSSTIQVANLTMGVTPDRALELEESDVYDRANTVIQLEVVQNAATVGFSSTQPNILIPWPSSNSLPENMTMTYESDVIRFNLNCSWNAPEGADPDLLRVSIGDDGWSSIYSGSLVFNIPAILPLTRLDADKSTIPICFLFIGEDGKNLNLAGIPSMPWSCEAPGHPMFNFSSDLALPNCKPALFSMLLCDPQPEILPATIKATMSSLEATLLSGPPTVKNVPIDAANYLFSTAFLFAASSTSLDRYTRISPFSYQVFFPNDSFTRWHASQYQPLSLDEINQNLTKAVASAAKAFLNGYFLSDDNPTAGDTFAMVNTSAVIEVQKLALVGRKPYFIASSGIVGLLVVLLGALVVMTRPDQMESFELENIVRKMR